MRGFNSTFKWWWWWLEGQLGIGFWGIRGAKVKAEFGIGRREKECVGTEGTKIECAAN
jgi:hypothetical protein